MAIYSFFQNGGHSPCCILRSRSLNREYGAAVQTVSVRHLAKFCGDRSNRCADMAIFRFVKMADTRHVGFYKFEILSADKFYRDTVRYHAKFHGDLSNR